GGTGVMVSNQQSPPQQTDQKPVLPPESPVQEEEKQLTEKPADPINPIQEATPATPLLTGTITGNYTIVQNGYWAARDNTTVTLDANGVLTSFLDTSEGVTSLGTAQGSSSGNDGVIAWGRWSGGTTAGAFTLNTAPSQTELHYVVGIAPTAMPTSGEATYSMIGATPPSGFEGVTALTSSSLKINFGTSSGVFHGAFTMSGQALTTLPGGANISVLSGGRLTGGGCMVGACIGGNISLQGILAGAEASRAGMTYQLNAGGGITHGAIAYKKD
ncbi:MAG TPA: hypothetical protein VG873_18850, partial [Burkholderiales bacterium]|nr:hypothetical protein [Burkholderiales bacterium]